MLYISSAKESDASRIADVHMAAFGSNDMLLAQFPTPTVREGLKKSIADKVTAVMRNPHGAALVVRDSDRNDGEAVVAYAMWYFPREQGAHHESQKEDTEEPWHWPEGSDMETLDSWTRAVESAQEAVGEITPGYYLSFVATHPAHQRRGAATMLMRWALDRCDREDVPASLESTLDAVPFYKSLGFTTPVTISMRMPGRNDASAYEEQYMVYRPTRRVA